jgi:hypothetical protein
MKRIFLLIISALYILQVTAVSVSATYFGELTQDNSAAIYAGIISILCATIGIMVYVITTYFKK